MLAARAQYLLFGPEKSRKNKRLSSRNKVGLNKKKKIVQYVASYTEMIQCKWSECDVQVGVRPELHFNNPFVWNC